MRMSQKNKTALKAVGIAVALYLIFQFGFFPLWDSLQEARASLPMQEKKLEKYQEITRTAGLRNTEASSAEARLREAEGGLLTSKTAALASAEMQDLMNQLTAAKSIEVRSSEFLPAKPLGVEYVQVPLGLNFQCRLDQLTSLLDAIGNGPKYFAIPKLIIQFIGAKDKQIMVNMQIAGIMRLELPPEAKSGKANMAGRN